MKKPLVTLAISILPSGFVITTLLTTRCKVRYTDSRATGSTALSEITASFHAQCSGQLMSGMATITVWSCLPRRNWFTLLCLHLSPIASASRGVGSLIRKPSPSQLTLPIFGMAGPFPLMSTSSSLPSCSRWMCSHCRSMHDPSPDSGRNQRLVS
uniref:Uncharacterized protein n=1 Tax=uncultured marine group II/III euryarchaeote KM3_57_A03 TaxID=1456462 RepID=A0A075HE34_9EURY|nr:hypothetical protein [uncultured marine group II/III euryarchaeote KM3_57_A03]